MMGQGGDDRAGFATKVDLPHSLVHSRCWGFWHDGLASNWEFDALAAVHQVRSSPWCILVDLDRFVPQRPSVQEAVRAVAVSVASQKPRGAVFLTGNAITKLQLIRLLREERCGVWSFRGEEGDALDWLERVRTRG